MWWRKDLVASYVVKNAPAEKRKGKKGRTKCLYWKGKKNMEDWEEYMRG